MVKDDSQPPIFLIGLPRSGTTLLQSMLSSHSEIFSYSEGWFLLPLLYSAKPGGVSSEYFMGNAARVGLEDQLSRTAAPEDVFRASVKAFADTTYQAILANQGKKYLLDKTPLYYLIVDELAKVFPDSRFVFLLRNPVWNLASTAEAWFEGNCLAIGRHSPVARSLLDGPKALADAIDSIGNRGITIRYEDLVRDPESSLRGISSHLGVAYESGMLTYDAGKTDDRRLGDRKIAGNSSPVQSSLKIPALYEDASNLRHSLQYLERIGPETYERLGYNYEDTRNLLLSKKGSGVGARINWHVAFAAGVAKADSWRALSFARRSIRHLEARLFTS